MQIKTTQHALERFIERVQPKTYGTHRKYLSRPENAKRALHSIANSQELIQVESKNDRYDGYFESYGKLLPIRLVIRDGVLVTLWPTGGWRSARVDIHVEGC